MSDNIRVRFAPSPTGPLHIGGVRTALYNYLFAKKHGGTFILRIEDTDQARYVDGAENYILDALEWLGLSAQESVRKTGPFGPYRQSERRHLYQTYVDQLIADGHAYYAFDTPEELEAMRQREMKAGAHSPKYDQSIRLSMKNSLTLDKTEVDSLLSAKFPFTVRIRIPENRIITFTDSIRGEVSFDTRELDDKVILKADGLPTYHLANVVDDHLMKISHVIRGEEWVSSTAHHVLLYEFLGWAASMPDFAHLPLILKPTGKGKLSKRDGAKFGFPVFPMDWDDKKEGVRFDGFRERGFLPSALINFLALLGWNPGTDQEIFSLDELAAQFSLGDINKSGAQFDFNKATWFNHQYIQQTPAKALTEMVLERINLRYEAHTDAKIICEMAELYKPRINYIYELVDKVSLFFEKPVDLDWKTLNKKYNSDHKAHFEYMIGSLNSVAWDTESIAHSIKTYITDKGLKFGNILPVLRILLTGESSGPDLFEIIRILGRQESLDRLEKGLEETIKSIHNA